MLTRRAETHRSQIRTTAAVGLQLDVLLLSYCSISAVSWICIWGLQGARAGSSVPPGLGSSKHNCPGFRTSRQALRPPASSCRPWTARRGARRSAAATPANGVPESPGMRSVALTKTSRGLVARGGSKGMRLRTPALDERVLRDSFVVVGYRQRQSLTLSPSRFRPPSSHAVTLTWDTRHSLTWIINPCTEYRTLTDYPNGPYTENTCGVYYRGFVFRLTG